MYPKILVAILIVFFPVTDQRAVGNARDGPRHDQPGALVLATRMQVFTMVEYPTTLPSLFSGLRIASTLAVIGVVVGELVGGNMGLGYMLVSSSKARATPPRCSS
jgi:NitT/TauT family transport system permease protein